MAQGKVRRRPRAGSHERERSRQAPRELPQRLGRCRVAGQPERSGGEGGQRGASHGKRSACSRSRAASASPAAACSAAFLVRPTPRP